MKMQPNDTDLDADALVELLDSLCASGTQHINLTIGEETKVQTVSRSDCNPQLGPCAVPNLGGAPDENDEEL
ncbi:MAG: hypothetical protein K6F80_03240 [Oscillospiraceae bacterium]|nr:hypothetical protein [Oscillospiraceae bacterium]